MRAAPSVQPPPEASIDDVAAAVLEASMALVAVAARSIAEVPPSVGVARFRVLVVLAEAEPRLVREVAEELGVHPSSASRLCDGLVRSGLITRRVSPTSRREVELRLSAKGRRLVERVLARRREEITRILAEVPAAQHSPLAEALRSFAVASSTAGPPPARAGGR